MTTQTLPPEVERYLAEVREQLDDLTEEDRAELLEDVNQHLAAIVEEGSDGELRGRLGEPRVYANEMRVAAGLEPRGEEAAPRKPRSKLTIWSAALWSHRWVRAIRRFSADLAPGWWVLRGVLIACLPFWAGTGAGEHIPIPAPGGEHVAGVTLIALAVALSVALGKLGRAKKRRTPFVYVGAALTALVLLATFNVYATFDYILFPKWALAAFAQSPDRVERLTGPNGVITNIYPYDAQGNPLENVLLFDQDGRPLRSGTQEWWKDGCRRQILHPQAADGGLVEFSYPYRYEAVMAGGPQGSVFLTCASPPRPGVPIPPLPVKPFPLGEPQP